MPTNGSPFFPENIEFTFYSTFWGKLPKKSYAGLIVCFGWHSLVEEDDPDTYTLAATDAARLLYDLRALEPPFEEPGLDALPQEGGDLLVPPGGVGSGRQTTVAPLSSALCLAFSIHLPTVLP